jgi:hypothetical protein
MSKQTLQLSGIPNQFISTLTTGTYLSGTIVIGTDGKITSIVAPAPVTISTITTVYALTGTAGNININRAGTDTAVIDLANVFPSGRVVDPTSMNSITIDSYGRYSTSTSLGIYPSNFGITTVAQITTDQNGSISSMVQGINSSPTVFTSATFTPVHGNWMGTIAELYNTKTGATGVVTHDFSTGGQWRHTAIAGNFTANFTNVPITSSTFMTNVSLFLVQGATAYIPNGVQINSSAQTIKWAGGSVPTGTANKFEHATFSLIYIHGTWTVLGGLASYG